MLTQINNADFEQHLIKIVWCKCGCSISVVIQESRGT